LSIKERLIKGIGGTPNFKRRLANAHGEERAVGIHEIYEAVITYNKLKTVELVRAAIDQGIAVTAILGEGLVAPLDEVGGKFSDGDLFVPEMLAAAHAVKAGLEILRPHLISAGTASKGTIVIGTVKGDLHDIGKNIVIMMLEGAGFRVEDLGIDVEAEKFIAVAEEKKADIVALSALLTTTLPAMEATIALIREQCPKMKTLIGGAPVTDQFAKKIGADGFGVDAPAAVDIARNLLDV
jgi:5-methyltetrahydrofolate--homocysteine methyltransferase